MEVRVRNHHLSGIVANLVILFCLSPLTFAAAAEKPKADHNADKEVKKLATRSLSACARDIKVIDGSWRDRALVAAPEESAPKENLVLWYRRPAALGTEAMPIGNGRLIPA